MPEPAPGRRLDQPLVSRRRFEVDPDGFARLSERIARFLGTGRFLAIQSVIVVFWIALNLVAWRIQWDPYPFILLNLAFSTQAAYAAPLILLAQNRQDDRDRIALDEDRRRAERTKADTEYLARELAALRLAVGEMATRDYLRGEMEKLSSQIQTALAENGSPDSGQREPGQRESGQRAAGHRRGHTKERGHAGNGRGDSTRGLRGPASG
ncbi:MAG: DUF1003 domain-containing protein [Pseudonocardia sediminis]